MKSWDRSLFSNWLNKKSIILLQFRKPMNYLQWKYIKNNNIFLSHSFLASSWWHKYFIAFNIFFCIVLLVTEILSKCAFGISDCSNHVVPYQPEGLINIVNLFISLDADKLYSPFGNLFSAKFWKDLDIKSLTFNMTR